MTYLIAGTAVFSAALIICLGLCKSAAVGDSMQQQAMQEKWPLSETEELEMLYLLKEKRKTGVTR